MKLFPFLISFIFVAVACTAACNGEPSLPSEPQQGASSAEPVMDSSRLIDRLRVAGVSVLPAEAVNQPFFSVQGKIIKVNGEDVQVFQYAHAATAAEQAALVSPDGNAVGTSMPHWVGSPHFFRKELLLVLYLGDDEKVQRALEVVLGQQFAGK